MATSAAAGLSGASTSDDSSMVVYVTVPNTETADAIASKIVDARLAACVNILPGVTSVYHWEGKVNKDSELLLIMKTRRELLEELTAFVKANHPYDVPEVIGLPILGGSVDYLKWVLSSTKAPGAKADEAK